MRDRRVCTEVLDDNGMIGRPAFLVTMIYAAEERTDEHPSYARL